MTVRDYLSNEEIRALMVKSDWRGAWEVLYNWLWIAAAMTLVAFFPNPFTVVVAMFIIGGKQLGCAIIMHDASHYSLFKSQNLNIYIGNWFGGYPIFHDVVRYRPYHLKHHAKTGRPEDPDLGLTKGYPTSGWSLTRKFFRDLSGLTGLKANAGLLAMHLEYLQYTLGGMIIKQDQRKRSLGQFLATLWRNLAGPLAFNLLFFGLLYAIGQPYLYLLWIGSLFTTYNFCIRVRSIAEHSCSPDQLDDHRNTRTTYANIIEQTLFAPLNVNYHAEHHLLMAAPSYNYPKLHKMLKERGFYEKGLLAGGYIEILKMALTKPTANV